MQQIDASVRTQRLPSMGLSPSTRSRRSRKRLSISTLPSFSPHHAAPLQPPLHPRRTLEHRHQGPPKLSATVPSISGDPAKTLREDITLAIRSRSNGRILIINPETVPASTKLPRVWHVGSSLCKIWKLVEKVWNFENSYLLIYKSKNSK
jgi:hypothetical protein